MTLVAVNAACGPDEAPPTRDSVGHVDQGASGPAEVTALLNAANQAFRERELDVAMEGYRRVTELAPDLPTGWFGIFMVESLNGNRAAADSAFQRALALAPAGAPPMPPGTMHPPLDGGADPEESPPNPHGGTGNDPGGQQP